MQKKAAVDFVGTEGVLQLSHMLTQQPVMSIFTNKARDTRDDLIENYRVKESSRSADNQGARRGEDAATERMNEALRQERAEFIQAYQQGYEEHDDQGFH